MAPAAPSRAARLGYLLVNVVIVLALVFAAIEVANAVTGAARNGDMLLGETLPVEVQIPAAHVSLPPGLHKDGWITTTVQVSHPTAAQEAIAAVMNLSKVALFIAVLWQVRGLAGSVKHGEPFGSANVRRLRAIGFLLVVGGPLVEVVNASARTELYDRLPPGGGLSTAGYEIPGNLIIAGLAAFILAEVFAHGLRLREDAEGTI
jgi:hypothetical protein